ncbi:hypothetical protein C2W59_01392 [Bacillus pumilus]|nr:hypothetical protein C2W59_01392 [Bacillus pumilus]
MQLFHYHYWTPFVEETEQRMAPFIRRSHGMILEKSSRPFESSK